jgi:hypothetical protein
MATVASHQKQYLSKSGITAKAASRDNFITAVATVEDSWQWQ